MREMGATRGSHEPRVKDDHCHRGADVSAVRGSLLRRGAIGVALGVATLASALIASPASAASTTLVFTNGASGGDGAYSVTVPYATPPSYAVAVSDTADPSATIALSVSSGSAGCSLASSAGAVVDYATAGSCVITATDGGADKDQGQGRGDGNQSTQTSTLTLTVTALPQTITFTSSPPTAPVVGSTYTVSATGGSSGNAVAFSVDPSSTSGCAIAGDTVTFDPPAGTCTIDANQAGSGAYAPAATAQQTVTSALAAQTITFTNPNPDSIVLGSTPTYQIDGSASGGGSLTYATTSSTCTVSASGSISDLKTGACVVQVNAAATPFDAAAASATFTLDVLAPPVSPPPSPPPVVAPVTTPVVTTVPTLPPIVIPVSPAPAPKPKPKPAPRPVPKPKPTPRPAPTRSIVIKPFAQGSYTLTKPLMAQVWRLATLIKRLRYRSVSLAGYTDNVFTPAMDAVLIHERAVAVLHRLWRDLTRLRDAQVRLSIAPGTSIELVSLNTTAARRALNRRVVATLTAG